jgi:hypothetical protein
MSAGYEASGASYLKFHWFASWLSSKMHLIQIFGSVCKEQQMLMTQIPLMLGK